MHKNTRKLKPNASNNQRHNFRSSSIRDIIGDRRYNDQVSRLYTHGTEGIKKVKRTKVGDSETDDISNLGRNSSFVQCEATEDTRHFAAKTSEYAFFKKLKENSCSEVHVHPNDHDNQLNNVQQSDHFTREEIPNDQKENTKHVRFSLPIEKEQNDAQYSLFSSPCVSKNSEANNIFGADITNVPNFKPGACNLFSPSVGSKSKNSENKGVFSMKREKLCNLVANNKSLYDVNEVSSNRFDLVSALISRLLPPDKKNNSQRDYVMCQDQTDAKYKSCESYKRKSTESRNISYLDDDFSRSTKRLVDTDLLEWDLTGHSPKSSIQYNRFQVKAYKESLIEYPHMSYLDDDFYSSTERRIDTYNRMYSEESLLGGHSSKSSIRYNHGRTEYGFRNPNFDIDTILSFDESRNFQDLETSHFHNGPKLLEQPQTLLLGWEDNTEKDKFQLSGFDSQTEIDTFSTSLSPYTNRHLKHEHLLMSSIIPYTPKHLNGSFDDKEHSGSESFLFLIQSPANNFVRFLNTGLNSFGVDDENFVYRTDELSESRMKGYGSSSYMESFDDRHFDQIEYPLLLHDSSWNE